ncbi:MAG: rRNA pseudouridine synthase [Myxococcales bacterium]|nr:rRNA pseudouridine synthase [Myxococcales bacterium]
MPERLQKFLARSGVASRRRAEELILQGRVQVNGRPVTELGSKVEASDLVTVDGRPVEPPSKLSYVILYKPPGVVTTLKDPRGRPSVGDYLGRLEGRLFPVGRLDFDAEGALLLTNDGELAQRLLHPRYQVKRTYLAKVKGIPSEESISKLRRGVRLEDGMATPVEVSLFEKAERNAWLKIAVTEGRPHLVKRLCAAVGHPVVRLFRPSHAGVGVGGLRQGELRPLLPEEISLVKAVGYGKPVPEPGLRLPPRRHGHGAPRVEPKTMAPTRARGQKRSGR